MNTSTTFENKSVQQITQELRTFVADTYILYIKSQNFHWNVVDPRFHSLHEFFEKQYTELAEAVDLIAERIRALGEKAPGSMREFLDLTRLEESTSHLTADQMLHTLARDHELVIQWLRQAIDFTAKLGDQGTSDLFIQRIRVHEKTVWMIKSQFNR